MSLYEQFKALKKKEQKKMMLRFTRQSLRRAARRQSLRRAARKSKNEYVREQDEHSRNQAITGS